MVTRTAIGGGEIGVESDGGITIIAIDRPHRRNAVTSEMWRAIGDLFISLNNDDTRRVVILRGAGTDFSAGADISEFDSSRSNADSARLYEGNNSRAFASIRDCSIPVIAVIRGVCMGGGFGLAVACDIRIASHEAEFSIPAARLGLAYPQDAMIDTYPPADRKPRVTWHIPARAFRLQKHSDPGSCWPRTLQPNWMRRP